VEGVLFFLRCLARLDDAVETVPLPRALCRATPRLCAGLVVLFVARLVQ
jgi:hypothetical protein